MSERTRQIVLGVFLAGVLVVTVGAVGLFARHRQKQVTALGVTVRSEELGFEISMPKGWERIRVNVRLLGPSLAYMREPDPHAGRDCLTKQFPQRRIYFLVTPPQASDERIVYPLGKLLQYLDISDNYFDGYEATSPGPTRSGKYQRRSGVIRAQAHIYRNGRLAYYPIELGLYEQITTGQQVFWCVLIGNTQVNAADRALLEAVASSFRNINGQTDDKET